MVKQHVPEVSLDTLEAWLKGKDPDEVVYAMAVSVTKNCLVGNYYAECGVRDYCVFLRTATVYGKTVEFSKDVAELIGAASDHSDHADLNAREALSLLAGIRDQQAFEQRLENQVHA
jgi:hypothetical protein